VLIPAGSNSQNALPQSGRSLAAAAHSKSPASALPHSRRTHLESRGKTYTSHQGARLAVLGLQGARYYKHNTACYAYTPPAHRATPRCHACGGGDCAGHAVPGRPQARGLGETVSDSRATECRASPHRTPNHPEYVGLLRRRRHGPQFACACRRARVSTRAGGRASVRELGPLRGAGRGGGAALVGAAAEVPEHVHGVRRHRRAVLVAVPRPARGIGFGARAQPS